MAASDRFRALLPNPTGLEQEQMMLVDRADARKLPDHNERWSSHGHWLGQFPPADEDCVNIPKRVRCGGRDECEQCAREGSRA